MRVLVLGASGATGKQVVRQLMQRQKQTRILIRESAVLPKDIQEHQAVEIVKGNINELNDGEMMALLRGCSVVISCLGHNLTLKGMFGHPRYLVFEAIKRICETVQKSNDHNIKLILMSTTAYTNPVNNEKNNVGEKIIFSLLKGLLPPHRDNVQAADYLTQQISRKDNRIGWVAVRPDTLVNHDEVSPYGAYGSPVSSPIFNPGKTSRINVSHFMAELATDNKVWEKWAYTTPVVYNQ